MGFLRYADQYILQTEMICSQYHLINIPRRMQVRRGFFCIAFCLLQDRVVPFAVLPPAFFLKW